MSSHIGSIPVRRRCRAFTNADPSPELLFRTWFARHQRRAPAPVRCTRPSHPVCFSLPLHQGLARRLQNTLSQRRDMPAPVPITYPARRHERPPATSLHLETEDDASAPSMPLPNRSVRLPPTGTFDTKRSSARHRSAVHRVSIEILPHAETRQRLHCDLCHLYTNPLSHRSRYVVATTRDASASRALRATKRPLIEPCAEPSTRGSCRSFDDEFSSYHYVTGNARVFFCGSDRLSAFTLAACAEAHVPPQRNRSKLRPASGLACMLLE